MNLHRLGIRLVARSIEAAGFELRRARPLNGLGVYPIQTVVDVGANIGQFAARALQLFPDARVLCFEPGEGARHQLEKAAARSRGRIKVFPVALGDRNGRFEFREHLNHSASSSFLAPTATHEELFGHRTERVVEVELIKLDDAVEKLELDLRPDVLLKLDVQGFEDRVLAGATNTLKGVRAVLLEACLRPLYAGQPSFRDLVERLHAAGLEYAGNVAQRHGPEGDVVFLDALFVRR